MHVFGSLLLPLLIWRWANGAATTISTETEFDPSPRVNPPRERPPIVYFYSRGGRQITNRGAEVAHYLHKFYTS